jgi:hypothetical protein
MSINLSVNQPMITKNVKIALHLSFILIYSVFLNPLLKSFQKWDTMFLLAGVIIEKITAKCLYYFEYHE